MRALVNRLRALRRDAEGMTLVEFGLVAPVFFLMLFGLADVGQLLYARALLQGAVEQAARSSSLETADTSAADELVRRTVRHIAPGSTLISVRTSYYDFADIQRAERWNDRDGNGDCNGNETYTDENGNGRWDRDIGVQGNGGANDVVLYNVTVTFKRLFKVPLLPGNTNYVINAGAIKKNQPFADQQSYGSSVGSCP